MIFKFEPLYFKRVWGGSMLKTILGRNFPHGDIIGESWDLVDRSDFQSKLLSPQNNLSTIRELLETRHLEIMGPGWKSAKRFPLLIKWLDCSDRLSLQVHPPDNMARSLKGEPKTENWYVAHCKEDSGIFVGLKKNKTKKHFLRALKKECLETVCHRIPTRPGDSILVKSGSLHAIDAGNLILEIQQNSDTTFRVYDWGRTGIDGSSRELHLEESLKCIDFNDIEPKIVNDSNDQIQVLADCEHFRIRKFKIKSNQVLNLKDSNDQCMIINPLNSEIDVGNIKLAAGDLGLSPFINSCEIKCSYPGDIIVTDNFHKPSSVS